ncbi:MAG: HAD family phosphatase [Chitinophagaceae bacterium]
MTKPKALIFDMNGTMIDDMAYHVRGWFDILNDDLGAGLNYEEVKSHMYGKNDEVLLRIFGEGRFTGEEVKELSMEKERRYQSAYMPKLALIAGLGEFLEQARLRDIPMSIGSAAIPFNIDFVLDNLNLRHYFKAIVSADDVVLSKPHPETFTKAAELMGIAPGGCVVFEDAPKGVEAAMNAGMPCVVLTTLHGKEEFDQYPNVLYYINDYTDPVLESLL